MFTDGVQNQLFVWLPGRDDGSPDGKRSDALLAQCLHQFRRGFGSERGFLFCGGFKEQSSVLRDHAIEKINPGKNAEEIGKLSPRDEKKPPAGSPEGYERICGRVVDNAVLRERAVVVGRQTADIHGSPLGSPPQCLPKTPERLSQFLFWNRPPHCRSAAFFAETEQHPFFQD